MRETPADPLIGTIVADRYRILGPVGSGGAGQVYRALQLQLEREVALKVVHPDVPGKSRAEFEARFYREASLAGRLSHPHIVHTIDYGTTPQGDPFLVMELLRGRTMRQALKGGALDPVESARLGAEVARGLHHAHAKGLIHRDVKASNIFLVRDEEGIEHARLLDFGLVKSIRRELDITQTPTYLGTPLYMSPEQARGEIDIDARSDIYALGVMLYRMLCGQMPYRAETPMGTALLHISEPYPPMRTRSDVPVDPDLEAIVRKCLAKKPEDRWPDAAQLAKALDAWREGHQSGTAPKTKESGSKLSGAAAGALGAAGALLLGTLALGAVVVAGVVIWFLLPQGPTEGPALGPLAAGVPATGPAPAAPAAPPEIAAPIPASQPVLTLEPSTPAPDPARSPEPLTAPSDTPRPVAPIRVEPKVEPSVTPSPVSPPDPKPTGPRRPGAGPESDGAGTTATTVSSDDSPFEPVVLDGATFSTLRHVKRAVAFVNNATREELLAAGVHEKVVDTVLTNRPYASLQRFAYTKGIGEATMAVVSRHTSPEPD